MNVKGRGCSSNSISNSNSSSSTTNSEEETMMDLRRGPWTVEEDFKLIDYIANHGEGRWNSLARCAGLKRTGKSCRLRWLNYLRPDVRRGNITLEEQLLILELHSRWGNRWSKIAQYLPGRTDNEIKNYWRTRVQKHAKQLRCDVNSKQFKDTMRYLWIPRLVERIQANNSASVASGDTASSATGATTGSFDAAPITDELAGRFINTIDHVGEGQMVMQPPLTSRVNSSTATCTPNYTPENSSTAGSSDNPGSRVSSLVDYNFGAAAVPLTNNNPDYNFYGQAGFSSELSSLISPMGFCNPGIDFEAALEASNLQMMDGGDASSDDLWNISVDDLWSLQQQQQFNINM